MKTAKGIRVDLHVHTRYSMDSFASLEEVHKTCMRRNIIPAITDHNTIKGAVLYKKGYGRCIIGEEITTREGEIIGLFLKKAVPPFLSKEETCRRIKGQGGLVYVPHPFDIFRGKVNNLEFDFDIIEAFNSRSLKSSNQKAGQFAQAYNLLKGAGSDAHFSSEIGRSYVEMEGFSSAKEFLENLENAKLVTNYSPFALMVLTKIIKIVKICYALGKKYN